MAAIGCSVVQFWLVVPLASLVLSQRGIGSGVIGMFAIMPWLAVLLLLPFTPRLVRRFGAVACQFAIGWLCDRWRHRLMHRALIGLAIAGLLLLPALDAAGPLLWPFGFFFGGAVTGLYNVTTYLSGDAARTGELVTLIIPVTPFYTLGSIAGPAMAGWTMDFLPPQGLPVILAAASLLAAAAMPLVQRRRRHRPHCKAARRNDKLRAIAFGEEHMKARISWIEGRTFVGESGSGHMMALGRAETPEGGNKLISPMELVLMGAGGCTAYDVVHILEKGRNAVTGCVAELEAERAETEPKVFTKIHIHFIVTGKGLDAGKVERAIQLSAEKYCSATAMLGRTAAITHDFEVREE